MRKYLFFFFFLDVNFFSFYSVLHFLVCRMAKKRDLWASEGGTKAVSRPQPVKIAKKWAVTPDVLPIKKEAPRRRKLVVIRPNNRPAVPVPLPGQSYNPTDESHQGALKIAVKQLQKKEKAHRKFVQEITYGRDKQFCKKALDDTNWEEEVKEKKEKVKREKSEVELKREEVIKKKKAKKLKKLGKSNVEKEVKKSFPHRRHPDRLAIVKEMDELEKIKQSVEKRQEMLEKKREKRKAEKKENMQVKHYGRHFHTPLVVDVATSDQLVGSLRHLSGGNTHMALDRMKSLEERNLVPAKMRHTYNKRKILKPKGEVRIKREPFGVTPETGF